MSTMSLAAKDKAMNPAVLSAFALAIIAGGDPGAYADLAGKAIDAAAARTQATAIGQAGDELRRGVYRTRTSRAAALVQLARSGKRPLYGVQGHWQIGSSDCSGTLGHRKSCRRR